VSAEKPDEQQDATPVAPDEEAHAETEAADATAKAAAKGAAEQPAAEKKARKPARRKAAKKADEPEAEKQPVAEKQAAESADSEQAAPEKPSRRKKAPAPKAPVAKAPPAKAAAQEPVASEPAKRSRGAAPVARRKVVRAHARYVRTSARKARMVCGHLRGKSVQEARAILAFTPREVARDWSKLLESAVANAESNHELLEDDLIVREAYADEGPTIKRFRPRAMGRATPIRKRTSHLTITLTPSLEPGTTKRRS
jgi:ribosomal protein L22